MKIAAQPIRVVAARRCCSTAASCISRSTGKMGTRRDSRTMSATSSRCESSRRVMIFGDGRVIGVMDVMDGMEVKTYRPPRRFG